MPERLPHADQRGRYVVLRHRVKAAAAAPFERQSALALRGDHYDWMFEVGGELLTWASPQWLDAAQAAVVTATQLPPHRLAYLDYEGEISGKRGTVERVESGTHRLVEAFADRYAFAVRGGRTGVVTVYRTAASASWSIAFAP